ncbi:hypothetical protein [Pseudoalteromonas byunsanensis]|uniref:Uncharacterized protein n=1 Tax=Pseudoalteromonas byunsanensis TaxID=327939 RepID=A0A1S1NBP6_9GAMM|nr:hypothetical protein [Pseudoalteromonas byunsanensis]OHU97557.1 hypothetical protein BIW53_01985 [Pseudoalteromonas byunsanensis]
MNTQSLLLRISIVATVVALSSSCSDSDKIVDTPSASQPSAQKTFSHFGPYQALPTWSDWCPVNEAPDKCSSSLLKAVQNQNADSRKTVRAHGWQLWAGISSPLDNSGYDSKTNTSTMFGTKSCWAENTNKQPACSGLFPLWLSWPNTGLPYTPKAHKALGATNSDEAGSSIAGLIQINRNFSETNSADVSNFMLDAQATTQDPDPTKTQTVNTVGTIPTYKVPALAIVKQCGLSEDKVKPELVIAYDPKGSDTTKLAAWEKLNRLCTEQGKPDIICPNTSGICDGTAFVNQGDVMIATESLTTQAWNAIQNNKLYAGTSTLENLYAKDDENVAANEVASWFNNKFISTKHMFWPVKGCNPNAKQNEQGCRVRYGALPPWVPKNFKDKSYATNADYLGYEKWGEVVAIDTCGKECTAAPSATLKLAHVEGASAITTNSPSVYKVQDFMHLQVSEETLNNAFTATDRALLDQATIWAYGDDSKGFEPGDFLVVVAMHVNTKEIATWAFQSVWWSPMDDSSNDCPVDKYNHCFGQADVYQATAFKYSGLNEKMVTSLDEKVGTTWRANYLLTDSYGINYEIDGAQVVASNYFKGTPPKWATQRPDGDTIALLPVAMNPYIEPVIHPLGTNCQNCHRRAGIVNTPPNQGEYSAGVGRANYQNAQCPSLLADYKMPDNDPCMLKPWAWNQNKQWDKPANNDCQEKDGTLCKDKQAYPIVNTDLSWFVADGHVQQAK